MTRSHGVGVSRPRPDSEVKVRGSIRFAADRVHPGVLHARLVLGTHAHARILGIDSAAALSVPGVVAVMTSEDLGLRPGDDRLSQPLASSEIVFAGQPVALVIAESEAAAADGAELVRMDLEPLPAVVDPVAAMAPDAPLVRVEHGTTRDAGPAMDAQTHAAVGGTGDASIEQERWSPNVAARTR